MFNTKDILTRLQNGDSIEAIAAEMTSALNDANEAYIASKEAEDRKAALTEAANNLVSSLLEYVALVYPEAIDDITQEDYNELTSLLVNEADALRDVAAMCAALGDMKIAFAKPTTTGMPEDGLKPTCMAGCSCHREIPKEAEKAAEDVIAEFLRKNFLS